jgi:hypothetical protein
MMKKLFFILLTALPLLAENPKAFSALGDIIYNDAAVIKKLGDIASMKSEHEMINSYLIVCEAAKQDGFAVDSRKSDVDEKNYLALLRILSKEHDELYRKAELAFDRAMREGNEEDVLKLFASGAVDVEDKFPEIKAYYGKYHDEQELSVLADFIAKQEKLRAKREAEEKARRKSAKTYQQRKEQEKIKHFRERDAAEQRAREKALKEEMERTKEEVFEKQKRELQVEP